MPRNGMRWRRPYTTIYTDNYKFGNSLYADTLEGIDKKYKSPTPLGGLDLPSVPPHYNAELSAAAAAACEDGLTNPHHQGIRRMRSFNDFDTLRWSGAELSEEVSSLLSDDIVRRRKRRTILDEPMMMDSIIPEETFDSTSSIWMDKCREFQDKLSSISQAVAEARERLEAVSSRSRASELPLLASQIADTENAHKELSRTLARQNKQITDLQTTHTEIQKQLEESMKQINLSQKQCDALKSDLEKIKATIEQAARQASKPKPESPKDNPKSEDNIKHDQITRRVRHQMSSITTQDVKINGKLKRHESTDSKLAV